MTTRPNIIFLDFDGVICNPETCIAEGEKCGFSYIDPVSARLVRRLCEDHNCKLVISSSWRILFERDSIVAILSAACASLGNYVMSGDKWSTERSSLGHRGTEIKKWIDSNFNEFETFVILDDDSDMEPLHNNFVKTDIYSGFRFNHYLQAKQFFLK